MFDKGLLGIPETDNVKILRQISKRYKGGSWNFAAYRLQRAGLYDGPTKSQMANEILNDIFPDSGDVVASLIKKDVGRLYQYASKKGFVHYGSVPSTEPVIIALAGLTCMLKYKNFQITDFSLDTFMKGMEIIAKNSGENPSSDEDQYEIVVISYPIPNELMMECFKNYVKEEMKHEMLKEARSYFKSILMKHYFSKVYAKHILSLLLIELIKRIEKNKGIRVLKEDNDLWKILDIPRRSYQVKSKEVETIFGTLLDELDL